MKRTLLDKISNKDYYNNQLEEILAAKPYEESVKNLLLDILYKIENSYKDYKAVKPNSQTEEEYMQYIINIINKKCDSIKCIKPKINENTEHIVVDKEKKEIICYPILVKLLYAVSDTQKKENIVKGKDELLNKSITDLINIGNNINTVEPLRDFNGFSWNVIEKDIGNLYYNLIYQDLIILNGYEFFEEWANNYKTHKDYMELLEIDLKNKYGTKNSNEIFILLRRIAVFLELITNIGTVKKVYDDKKKIESELEKLNNSENYIIEITEKRKKLLNKVKNIDIMLNDKELLKEEYDRRNSLMKTENKIFSVKVFAGQLKDERKKLMLKISEYNDMLHPKNFIDKQKKLQEQLKYRNLIETEDIEKALYEDTIALQKVVIKCIKVKIKNANDKNEVMNLMKELRYFGFIPIKEKQTLCEIEELKKALNIARKDIFFKANELKLINEIVKDPKINIAIYNYLFSTKIILLDETSIKIAKNKEGWYIQFLDEGITDEIFRIDAELEDEDVRIKINKKVKLFN